jgi:hypothetical protein
MGKDEKKAIMETITGGELAKFRDDVVPDMTPSIEVLYQKAKIAYIVDPHLRSVDFFYHIMDGELTLDAFRRRTKKEKWGTLRTKARQQAEAALIKRLSNQIMRDQIEEANDCQKLRKWLFGLLTPEEVTDDQGEVNYKFKVRANSLEGVVGAYKQVTILLQAYRQEVLSQLEPIAHGSAGGEEEEGPFTAEEAGEMARALLERRGAIDVGEEEK